MDSALEVRVGASYGFDICDTVRQNYSDLSRPADIVGFYLFFDTNHSSGEALDISKCRNMSSNKVVEDGRLVPHGLLVRIAVRVREIVKSRIFPEPVYVVLPI